jgi:hypothetical protein
MCGTLKIIDVYEEENLTCRARCVKQVTLREKRAAPDNILLTPLITA